MGPIVPDRPLCQRKAEGGLENGLANLWSRRKITKKAHAVRGQEIKWEISTKLVGCTRMGFFTATDCSVYRRWVNVIASVPMSGGAHFLTGKKRAAVIWFLITYCAMLVAAFLYISPLNKSYALYQAAKAFYSVVWIVMLVDACRTPIPILKKINWVIYVVVAIAIALVPLVIIRQFLFQPFSTPSGSMQPTLMGNERTPLATNKTGDHFFVSKMAYWFHEPKRGDIIAFLTDGTEAFPHRPVAEYVKRIVGVPGDTVCVHAPNVLINGKILDDPPIFKNIAAGADGYSGYANAGLLRTDDDKIVLGKDEYLVFGDNSQNSFDGRYFGAIKRSNIKGKVVLIYWPFERKGRPE
jgi:signal peptidase I